MIICGWCGAPTKEGAPCQSCGRDPAIAYEQRRVAPIRADIEEPVGRPPLNGNQVRKKYAEAVTVLQQAGIEPTVEAIADKLDRSPRTIREWKARFGL